jgi:hypothetical protein
MDMHDGEDLILREVLQASSIEISPDHAAQWRQFA